MFDFNTRVLVVDSMISIRKLLVKILGEIGFKNLIEASDGIEGWQAISSSNPPIGLVLTEWKMPKSTGMDLLKRVRAENRFRQLPVLFVTSETEKDKVVEAVKAGVTEYVVKPFNRTSIEEKIKCAYVKSAP